MNSEAMEALIGIVKPCEGFHRVVKQSLTVMAVPYICPAGFWTQGWGHLCQKDSPPISEDQGEVLLASDLSVAEAAVRRLITWPLNDFQIAALTDWTFNLGSGRLKGSTLRAVINRGDLDAVPDQIRRWKFGGGRVLPGLVMRRELDVGLWFRQPLARNKPPTCDIPWAE